MSRLPHLSSENWLRLYPAGSTGPKSDTRNGGMLQWPQLRQFYKADPYAAYAIEYFPLEAMTSNAVHDGIVHASAQCGISSYLGLSLCNIRHDIRAIY